MMQQVEFSKEAFQKVHFRLGDGIKIFKNHRLIEFQQGEERGVMCDESLQEEVVARFDIGDQRLRLFGKQQLEEDIHQDFMDAVIEDLPIMQPVKKHD